MKIAQLGTDSVLLAPVAASTAVQTSSNLDLAGANYATIRLVVTAEVDTGSTNVGISFEESDNTDASNFATFNATFNRTVDNTAATVATTHIDAEGRKRYIRLLVTPDSDATTGAIITAGSATTYKDVISESATMLGPDVEIG